MMDKMDDSGVAKVHPVAYIRKIVSESPMAKAFTINESTQYGDAMIEARILRGRTVFSDFLNQKNIITAVLDIESAADHCVACMIIASHDMSESDLLRNIWANPYSGPYRLVVIIYPNGPTQNDSWVGRYHVMIDTDYKRALVDYTVAAVSSMGDQLNAL